MAIPLPELAAWLDALLRTREVPDYPPAQNGVQLAHQGPVTRVATAVDFSARTAQEAAARGANLLLVHHGMFWGGARPIVGPAYDRLRVLLEHDVAVYASHLPLDVHPELGNNALLAEALGLRPTAGFARFQAIDVGVRGECDLPTATLVERARAFARAHQGDVVATAHAAEQRTRRWGICTGAGASSDSIREAIALGLDTLIVGEGPHHTAVEAADHGLVVIYAGHYATETLGVRAVAQRIEREFGIPWFFIEAPTGL
ncbi:MAG TPA: Nif3-like dinuclear metal center hexameric protein [Gemmatimonadaceae bacterium]|jgi:dinuclear metal center YbgI/SA1388 family protein